MDVYACGRRLLWRICWQVRQRLLEMMPDISVFLDVEDLEDISNLQGYIERSHTVLVYCSQGYFQSKNCMIELTSTVKLQKPIVALMDPEKNKGGLTTADVHSQLLEADASYAKWGFGSDVPRADELFAQLFAADYIEWNRIGCFRARAAFNHLPCAYRARLCRPSMAP